MWLQLSGQPSWRLRRGGVGAPDAFRSYLKCVHRCTLAYLSYYRCMPAPTSVEIGVRELRTSLSEVLNETAVRGRITYVTSHGRRVGAIVPVPEAEAIEAKRDAPEGDSPA